MGTQSLAERRGSVIRQELLRLCGWGAVGLLASAVVVIALFDRASNPLCATPIIRERVTAESKTDPNSSLYALSGELHQSMAVVLDALPPDRRVGVSGQEINVVWQSLRTWPHPALHLAKGDQHFWVRAPLATLQAAPQRDVWILGGPQDALSARLHLTDIGAIYAMVDRSKHRTVPAVLFLDRHGEVIFQVSPRDVPEEHQDTVPPEFEGTFHLMRTLAPLCGR